MMTPEKFILSTSPQHEGCLICGADLEYLPHGESMECCLCHKTILSTARCLNGHFICDDCHIQDIDDVLRICLAEKSDNPVEILEKLMALPSCHMHGPEHHIFVGAALLTAYANAGGRIDLAATLTEIIRRGRQVPGGACGFWGACGAGISAGIFVSLITGSTPLAREAWGMSNLMTSQALAQIGQLGGPRCCKRDSYIAVREAVFFAEKHFHIHMNFTTPQCRRMPLNNQCLGSACPFSIRRNRV
ncbi:MAG: DUF5714 domain-containing protein [Desulfovibrionaceae bacterium]|nr:DUF5714 domain-containing protein [Desulfovibrionaceae bacterium]